MPTRADITHFGAGPAALPTDVLEKAAQALLDFNETGLGIAEHSHRSEHATTIINNAKADLASYLDIPDDYEILFMQGGGTGEFSATIYNLVGAWVTRQKVQALKDLGVADEKDADQGKLIEVLRKAVDEKLKVDYIVTGGWSDKAHKEAIRLLGPEHVNLVADSRTVNDGKFGKIPDESTWKLSKDPAFVYYCDNETVDGVEFPKFPRGPHAVRGWERSHCRGRHVLQHPLPEDPHQELLHHLLRRPAEPGMHRHHHCRREEVASPPTTPQPSPTLVRKLGLPLGPIVLSYEIIAKNNSLYNTLSIFE